MSRGRDEPGELPQGVLTFLLTDIEGSTPLWERHGADMGAALARHEALIAATVAGHGATAELVADQLPPGGRLVDVGRAPAQGLSRPEHVFALAHPDLAAPPPTLTRRAEHPDGVTFVGRRAERAALDTALDSALGGQVPLGTLGSASHHLGLLAATLGRRDEAAAHLQAAVQDNERLQAPLFAARDRRQLAELER